MSSLPQCSFLVQLALSSRRSPSETVVAVPLAIALSYREKTKQAALAKNSAHAAGMTLSSPGNVNSLILAHVHSYNMYI